MLFALFCLLSLVDIRTLTLSSVIVTHIIQQQHSDSDDSDDSDFLKPILNYVKQLCPSLKIVHYFTEGAASQYKNYKNIANLLHHLDDFQLVAEWHFFATSHGLLATCHPYFPFDCDVAQSFYFSLGIFVFTVSNH